MDDRNARLLWVCASILFASPVLAQEPMKRQCLHASDDGQYLQRAGRSREAAERFGVCASMSCPKPLRETCASRLKESKSTIATILFVAKDRLGKPVAHVKVAMDGVPITAPIDGVPIETDPGEHVFQLDADGYESISLKREIHEAVRVEETVIFESKVAKVNAAPAPTTVPIATSNTPIRPPRRGFQIGARLSYGLPAGRFDGIAAPPLGAPRGTVPVDDDLSRFVANRVSAVLEVGWRVNPSSFIGLLAGTSGGKVGDSLKAFCSTKDVTCVASVDQLMPVFQYFFLPNELLSPWIESSVPFVAWEAMTVKMNGPNGGHARLFANGETWVHLAGGLDIWPRFNNAIAIGLFAGWTLSKYTSAFLLHNGLLTGVPGAETRYGFADDFHSWFDLGLKVVFLPANGTP